MAVQNYNGHWSRNGKSSVYRYEIKLSSIHVYFLPKKNQSIYRLKYVYFKSKVGNNLFEEMSTKAIANRGLNTLINRTNPTSSSQSSY